MVEADAEDLSNWTVRVGGETLDLTGSAFDLDPATPLEIAAGPSFRFLRP